MIEERDYTLAQDRLAHIAHNALRVDLDGFLQRLRITRKAAVKLDPELYVNLDDVESLEAVAAATHDYRQRLKQIRKDCRRRWARRGLKGELLSE